MKYIDEFRDPILVGKLLERIAHRSTQPVQFMEFCGGHTHAIFKHGLRQLLPATIRLRSGPGCPVCVTAALDLEYAIALAQIPKVILTTFGDMMRVPASQDSLQQAKARGADVRMVYSTLDALAIARRNPERAVVFLGVGFETTVPTVAAALLQAESEGLANFYVHSVHKLTPPATRAILDGGQVQLQGIIGPGHVTAIIGAQSWEFLPQDYGLPCAVAGFEPLDILHAIVMLVEMVEGGEPAVGNAYERGVSAQGNRVAQEMVSRVFEIGAANWRGFGPIPASGLAIRPAFAHRDAALVFAEHLTQAVDPSAISEPKGCRCGEILRGELEPSACPLFGQACTPRRPVGPCMVSSEGACAAYHRYGAAI